MLLHQLSRFNMDRLDAYEQSSGIEQINQAVAQMDEMTQQNAAMVEEAAAATESLEEEAQHLAQSVSVFKLVSSGSSGSAQPQARCATATHHARRPMARIAARQTAKHGLVAQVKRLTAKPKMLPKHEWDGEAVLA